MAERGTTRRVLVTGGAGFIGSHLVEALLAAGPGDDVTIIDDLSTGRIVNLAGVRGDARVRVINGDCAAELDRLEPLIRSGEHPGFDEVYHLAAAVGVQLVVEQPIACIETNIEQTSRVLRFALVCDGGKAARTLIASSSEVYGKSEKVPFSEEDDCVYGPTTKTRWSYAMTKALDEHLALAYFQQHGLPTVIARFFNTVGPRQVGEYGMVLPRFVRAALDGQPLRVHGDGLQSRCFCDVRDVAETLPKMLRNTACLGRVFNIGSDRSISIRALAELVVKVVGSTSEMELVPYDRAFGSGFEDLRRREPDLRRLRAAVGFAPTRSLEQTIADLASQIRSERKAHPPVPSGPAAES